MREGIVAEIVRPGDLYNGGVATDCELDGGLSAKESKRRYDPPA